MRINGSPLFSEGSILNTPSPRKRNDSKSHETRPKRTPSHLSNSMNLDEDDGSGNDEMVESDLVRPTTVRVVEQRKDESVHDSKMMAAVIGTGTFDQVAYQLNLQTLSRRGGGGGGEEVCEEKN